MNLYEIKVWGPCKTEEEVQDIRKGPHNDKAIVFAPNKNVANHLCYIVATREAKYQSNYQELDSFSDPGQLILVNDKQPFFFSDDIVEELISEPILPLLPTLEIQRINYNLYFARCIDDRDDIRGQFWTYAIDELKANLIATQFGDDRGLFQIDTEAIRVELFQIQEACVFWNADVTRASFSCRRVSELLPY